MNTMTVKALLKIISYEAFIKLRNRGKIIMAKCAPDAEVDLDRSFIPHLHISI